MGTLSGKKLSLDKKCFCFLQAKCGLVIQQLEIILTAHLSAVLPYWWRKSGTPVGECPSFLAQNPSRLGSGHGSVSQSLARKATGWAVSGFTMAVKYAASLFIQTHWGESFSCVCPTHYVMFPQRIFFFEISFYSFPSHGPSPPVDTLSFQWRVSLSENSELRCVRTLNHNKFMYAAAPLLENKFYLLINWYFFLVSTKTKIYTWGSEP